MLTTDPLHAHARVLRRSAARSRPTSSCTRRSSTRYALRTPDGLLLVDPGFDAHLATRCTTPCAPGATRRCTRRSTRTATSITPSACAPSSPPASAPQIVAQENCVGALPPLRASRTAGTRASTSASSACRSRSSREHFDWPTLTFRDAPDAAPRRPRRALPRRQGRDRRRLLGVGAGAPLPVHRRPDHLAGAELRQSAEGAALPGGLGRRARGHGRARRRVALPRPRPRGAGPRRGAHGAHRDGALPARHHRPGARAHERRADAGGDLPRRRARPGAGDAPVSCAPTTTIRSSSSATCCACGAAGGTATPPTCCRRPWAAQAAEIARARRRRRRRSSRAAARCSTPATPCSPRTSPSGRRAPRPTTAPRRSSSATSTQRRLGDAEALMAQGIYRAAMHDARARARRGADAWRRRGHVVHGRGQTELTPPASLVAAFTHCAALTERPLLVDVLPDFATGRC